MPAGRYGRYSDIESAVLFLASDAAEYVTGAQLKVKYALLLVCMNSGQIVYGSECSSFYCKSNVIAEVLSGDLHQYANIFCWFPNFGNTLTDLFRGTYTEEGVNPTA